MNKIVGFFYITFTMIQQIWDALRNTAQLKLARAEVGKGTIIKGGLFLRSRGKVAIGEGVTINSNFRVNPIGGNTFTTLYVEMGGELYIGDNVGISNSTIYVRSKVEIGDRTLIGGDCRILDSDFHSLNYIDRQRSGDRGISKQIRIGCDVFIGCGTTILKGVLIGDRSVIAAGSVVSCDIPCDELWGGNPIKFIRPLCPKEV